MHAIVGGVLGNTAANAVDTEPLSRTVGLSLGVALVPLSATTFAMYLPSSSTGALAPLAGNGTYAGGGTITPGLTAGQILLGRDHTRFELSPAGAPPFIAFVPAPSGVKFNARAPAHGAVRLTGELANQIKYRALWTEWTLFEVHTWGAAYPPDSKLDFDVTQRLYQQVIQSVHLLCSGDYRLDEGSWDDQAPKATQLVKLGHYNVMRIALGTPVLEFAMPFVVPPITLSPTTYFQPPDGSAPEVGCQG
jgi:hypothetical protein